MLFARELRLYIHIGRLGTPKFDTYTEFDANFSLFYEHDFKDSRWILIL